MKLFYYTGKKNFGDLLNLWLWSHLLPNFLNEDSDTLFVGIGTLLNERVPLAKRTIIFGTGVGYGQLPNVDNSWIFYCVRGPLSAQALSLPPEKAIVDPGILINKFAKTSPDKCYKCAYMPHFNQAQAGEKSLQKICRYLGFNYIDPKASVEEVIYQISQTEVLITEAMHGAITAEALRIPWIPVKTNKNILHFKWEDFCLSLDLPYQPKQALQLNDPIPGDLASLTRNLVKFTIVLPQIKLIAQSKPYLSKESVFKKRTEQLEAALDCLREDVLAGRFS